jgi:hypothetical protein
MSTATFTWAAPVPNPPVERRPADVDFGRRPAFPALARVELRKMVDTRSGRWLLAAILGLSAVALGWRLTHLGAGPLDFAAVLDDMLVPVDMILPVIGIMAMTSEWTQRTALTTFTMSPRRVRVVAAKVVAAVVLTLATVAVVVGLALAGTALGGTIGGHGSTYDDILRTIGGAALADGLNVLMAAGIGLVAVVTAVGVLVFYVAPTTWALAGPALLGHGSRWLDVFQTFDNLSRFDVSGHLPQTVTSLGVWVVLPLVVGLALTNRREVK